MPIYSFESLTVHLKQTSRIYRLAVVCGSDQSTVQAVMRAVCEGFAHATFVGDVAAVKAHACVAQYSGPNVAYVEADTHEQAAERAVRLVREGGADALIKGLLHTSTLLRAVLNKEWGLLPLGQVLTHIAAAQMPHHPKLLFFTDAAVIPYPTHEQRLCQVGYLAQLLHRIGIEQPRIALVHCAETVSEKFPHTLGYADIKQRAASGQWGPLLVDGPLDLRTALDAQALRTKGISSCLQGRADALVLPDIEAGNVLYKVLPLFASARVAGTLQGTIAPVVLPSRGDNAEAKYNSLALALVSRD